MREPAHGFCIATVVLDEPEVFGRSERHKARLWNAGADPFAGLRLRDGVLITR
jgi:hypothetical protein